MVIYKWEEMGIIALAKGFKNIKKKYKKKSFKLQLMRHIVHIYIYIYTHTHMLLKINKVNPMWCKSHFDHSQFQIGCSRCNAMWF